MPIVFELTDDQKSSASKPLPLNRTYSPKVRGSFNLNWDLSNKYHNTRQYQQCVITPPTRPVYQAPASSSNFPNGPPNSDIPQPPETSLLPLLIAAHRNGVDIQQYDVISERNSFRKIAMNNEDYVVGVQKIGNTLCLRRYDRREINMNDHGHRFEQLCTPDYKLRANYHQLIEGRIGELRTLITAETDAISSENNTAIELKCKRSAYTPNQNERDWWLQAFLGGVSELVVGQRSTDRPLRLIGNVQYQQVATLLDDQRQNETLHLLQSILRFLREQVLEHEVYLFSRRIDRRMNQPGLYLYRVGAGDRPALTFISQRLLTQVAQVDLEGQRPRTERKVSGKYHPDDDDDDAVDNVMPYQSEGSNIEEAYLLKVDRSKQKKESNRSLRHSNRK